MIFNTLVSNVRDVMSVMNVMSVFIHNLRENNVFVFHSCSPETLLLLCLFPSVSECIDVISLTDFVKTSGEKGFG